MSEGNPLANNKSVTNNHLKSRVQSSLPIKNGNAFTIFNDYVSTMERWHHYTKPVQDMHNLFGDKSVRKNIEYYYGRDYLANIDDFVKDFQGINVKNRNDFWDAVTMSTSANMLSLSRSVGIKQVFSSVLWVPEMPIQHTLRSFLTLGQHRKHVDITETSAWKNRRLNRVGLGLTLTNKNNTVGSQSYFTQNIRGRYERRMKQGKSTWLTKPLVNLSKLYEPISKKFITPIKDVTTMVGDKIGIGWLGQGYADYRYSVYKKQNIPGGEKEWKRRALEDFSIKMRNNQQTDLYLEQSQFVKIHSQGLFRPFFMFTTSMSQQRQALSLEAQEIYNGKNVAQNSARYVNRLLVLGGLYTVSANGFLWKSDEDEPETIEDHLKTGALYIMKGHTQGIPVITQMLDVHAKTEGFNEGSPVMQTIKRIKQNGDNVTRSKEAKEDVYLRYEDGTIDEVKARELLFDLDKKITESENKFWREYTKFYSPLSLDNIGKIYNDVESFVQMEERRTEIEKLMERNGGNPDILKELNAWQLVTSLHHPMYKGKTLLEGLKGETVYPKLRKNMTNLANDHAKLIEEYKKWKKTVDLDNLKPGSKEQKLESYYDNKIISYNNQMAKYIEEYDARVNGLWEEPDVYNPKIRASTIEILYGVEK